MAPMIASDSAGNVPLAATAKSFMTRLSWFIKTQPSEDTNISYTRQIQCRPAVAFVTVSREFNLHCISCTSLIKQRTEQ